VLNFIFESLFVNDIVPIDIVGFFLEKIYIQISLKRNFILLYVKKKFMSENTMKIVFKNTHSIKNDQKNIQEMYTVQIKKTALEKKNFIKGK
jgi:hypothetical protein